MDVNYKEHRLLSCWLLTSLNMAGASRRKQFTSIPAIGPVEQSGSHMNSMQDD
jgi:hypothetical protein